MLADRLSELKDVAFGIIPIADFASFELQFLTHRVYTTAKRAGGESRLGDALNKEDKLDRHTLAPNRRLLDLDRIAARALQADQPKRHLLMLLERRLRA